MSTRWSQYAIWLLPERKTEEELARLIQSLSQAVRVIPFAPHLTLCSGTNETEERIRGKPNNDVRSRHLWSFISHFHLLLRNWAGFSEFLMNFLPKTAELFRHFLFLRNSCSTAKLINQACKLFNLNSLQSDGVWCHECWV